MRVHLANTRNKGDFQEIREEIRWLTRYSGQRKWLKTTDNCFVSETGLNDLASDLSVENCGAIGFLQVNYTLSTSDNETETGAVARIGKVSKVAKRSPNPEPAPIALPEPMKETAFSANYLINLTVGEDYAYCYTCANSTCDVQQKYGFNHTVLMQCYKETNSTNPNETAWYETTDFCWVREVDFWESLYDRELNSTIVVLNSERLGGAV